jgi:two-component system, OmpR family, KDP operon response regulator KdpE
MEPNESEMHRPRVRVLIVDDEPAICKALKIALERAGYEAIAAQSGDSALTVLALEPVDVLLLDLRIPDTRGDVVFELAAATHPHLRRQTLFMTGDISDRAYKLIQSCKCPWIRKPFELREMIAAVDALVPHLRRGARGQSA